MKEGKELIKSEKAKEKDSTDDEYGWWTVHVNEYAAEEGRREAREG